MKLKTMILLSGLLLGQTIVIPASASTNQMFSVQSQRRHHKAHIDKHLQYEKRRSAPLLLSGYVEDDVLVLSFSLPLQTTQLRIVDSETGNVVFEGTVSGTSLSIPLERDSGNFEIFL